MLNVPPAKSYHKFTFTYILDLGYTMKSEGANGGGAETTMRYKLSIIATPEPEGGFTITCKELPELITVGDSLDEAIENVKDAFIAVFEIYQDTGRTLPESIKISEATNPDEGSLIQLETLIPIQFEGLASAV